MDEPLSKSEERFIETSPLALGLFRIAGPQVDLLACSPSFASYVQGLVGTKREDFLSLLREDCSAVDFEVIKRDYDVGRLSLNGAFQTLFRLKDNTGHFAPFSAQGKLVNESGGTQRLYLFLFPVDGAALRSVEQKEEEERQSQLFDEILSTTKTAIFWKDAQRRFLGANTAFLDYYGFADEAAILGKNDEDMGWHSDPDPYKNDELRVLKEGISTFRVPGKCLAKGEERNIVASKSPLIVGGKIIGLVGSFEDVTLEVRHKEEIAKLNEELTRRVYEHERLMATSAVAIATIHLPDLSLVEANDSVYEIMGLSREEAAAKYHHSLSEFFAGESHQELDRFLDEVHRAVQQKKPSFSFSFHFPQVKGSLWVSGAGSFSAQDPSDVVVVYRDATDIMETQRRLSLAENEAKKVPTLSQENARLNSMIDGVPSGLGTLQIIDGVPADQIQLNQFFFSRIDVPSAQNGFLSVSAFPECLHPDDRENFVLAFKNLLRDKHLVAKQFRFRNRANGAYTWSSVRALITTISPHVEVAYIVFTDIQELKKAEKGLRESQYFYRQAVKAAGLKTWTYNLKDHSVSMSDGDYYGTEMESWGVGSHVEDVPKTILPLIDPADRQKLEGLYQKVDRGESASAEVWFSAQPGREPHCERITYFFPGGTASDKAIGLGQNITAEKKVAERYKREVEYLRASDDSNLLAKGHYNLTQNLVIGYSTKKEGLFVAKEGTRYTDAIQAFFDLPYREEEREELKKALNRDDLLKNSQLGDVSGNVIYRRKIPGAMPIWLSLSYHTYMMPETGDVELFCYGYDVSEKMESVEIMRIISKTEFDYIGLIFVEGGGFEFIEKDPKILFPEVRKIIPFESFRDFEKNTFISDENRSVYDQLTNPENILSALKTSDHYLGNYLRNEAGKIHCKKLDCAWLDKEAKILLMVRSDVTELYEKDQEQLQAIEAAKLEAEKANEAKSAFLSNMSHDLRTPLNGVIGFTDLALKESDPQKKQDYLEKINSSGKLLLDLINDTLELSRIESGKSVNEPEACDPKEVLPPVLTALRPLRGIKKDHVGEFFLLLSELSSMVRPAQDPENRAEFAFECH